MTLKVLKPGYKTWQFWVSFAADLSAFALAVSDVLPGKWAAAAILLSKCLYIGSRWVPKLLGAHEPTDRQSP